MTLFGAGLMACALFGPQLIAGPLVWITATVAALFGARVPAAMFFRFMIVPLGFLVAGAIALCVTVSVTNGTIAIGVSADGARTALITGVRAAGAVTVTLFFACTVACAQWVALLRRARVPESLLDLIQLVYRTAFLLDAQRAALSRAQDNRLGFRNLRVAMRSTARVFAALFVRSLQRAARLERGMAARGYTDRLPVLFPPSTATAGHYVVAIAVPGVIFAAAVLLGRLLVA